jgi:hypothetical protein
VPLTAIVVLVILAIIPLFAYHTDFHPNPYPYSPHFPYPLPEILTSIIACSFCFLLREPLWFLLSYIPHPVSILLWAVANSVLYIFLRLAVIGLLLISHHASYSYSTWRDLAFRRVWWAGLGWAVTEAAIAVWQCYDSLYQYKDVLVPGLDSLDQAHTPLREHGIQLHSTLSLQDSLQLQIEKDYDELVALKGREELEALFGVPFVVSNVVPVHRAPQVS